MNKDEPPSSHRSDAALFLIGRNSRGNWVVQDQRGLRGGLFLGRAEALKFAKSVNGNTPVVMVPGVLELDMSAFARTTELFELPAAATALKQVA
jgi:hypothetical protein